MNTKTLYTTTSKKDALSTARMLKAGGQACKVLEHSGIYTVPFKGITGFCNFLVVSV